MRAAVFVMLLAITGCRGTDTATPAEGTSPGDSGDGASGGARPDEPPQRPSVDTKKAQARGALTCAPLGDATEASELHARGVERLEAAREGEHYRVEPFAEGMEALRRAAELGHHEAQSLYGRRSFESMFLVESPRPEEREAYVTALAYIRIAGRRGDPGAADYLPGLLTEPDLTEPPFSEIPREWIREAIARADAWLSCHGSQ